MWLNRLPLCRVPQCHGLSLPMRKGFPPAPRNDRPIGIIKGALFPVRDPPLPPQPDDHEKLSE